MRLMGQKTSEQETAATVNFDADLDKALRNFRLWDNWERQHISREPWRRFNIDLSHEFLEMLDNECEVRGVPRQTLVKYVLWDWLRQQLDRRNPRKT